MLCIQGPDGSEHDLQQESQTQGQARKYGVSFPITQVLVSEFGAQVLKEVRKIMIADKLGEHKGKAKATTERSIETPSRAVWQVRSTSADLALLHAIYLPGEVRTAYVQMMYLCIVCQFTVIPILFVDKTQVAAA